jgi:hypothetical protein
MGPLGGLRPISRMRVNSGMLSIATSVVSMLCLLDQPDELYERSS